MAVSVNVNTEAVLSASVEVQCSGWWWGGRSQYSQLASVSTSQLSRRLVSCSNWYCSLVVFTWAAPNRLVASLAQRSVTRYSWPT